MPFKQVFERRVNEELQDNSAGPAPRSPARSPSPSPSSADSDIKKRPVSPKHQSVYEAEDFDFSCKGEKTLPPRFSTLFDTTKSAPPPPPTPRVAECCHRESKRKGGVYLSTPVFILLVVVLLFESTLLFAYTVIGLYQNLPSGLLAAAGAPTPAPVDGCHCDERQGAINFSPNFVFGSKDEGGSLAGQLSIVESMTLLQSSVTATVTASPTTSTSLSSETSTSTTTSATSTTADASAISQVLGLFSNLKHTSSTSAPISIVTSTPGVVHSTIIVTSSADASETESTARPTVTSVQIVDGPATTIQA